MSVCVFFLVFYCGSISSKANSEERQVVFRVNWDGDVGMTSTIIETLTV